MARLGDSEIDERLAGMQWRREGDTIVRDVECKGFHSAMALANAVEPTLNRNVRNPVTAEEILSAGTAPPLFNVRVGEAHQAHADVPLAAPAKTADDALIYEVIGGA